MRQFQGNTFFEYFVAPTFDFIQELRTHGTDIRVREPQKLVQLFRDEAEKAYQMYCQWTRQEPVKNPSRTRQEPVIDAVNTRKTKKSAKNALFFVFFINLWQVLTVRSSTFAPSNKKIKY